jgi:hypothetical protein
MSTFRDNGWLSVHVGEHAKLYGALRWVDKGNEIEARCLNVVLDASRATSCSLKVRGGRDGR